MSFLRINCCLGHGVTALLSVCAVSAIGCSAAQASWEYASITTVYDPSDEADQIQYSSGATANLDGTSASPSSGAISGTEAATTTYPYPPDAPPQPLSATADLEVTVTFHYDNFGEDGSANDANGFQLAVGCNAQGYTSSSPSDYYDGGSAAWANVATASFSSIAGGTAASGMAQMFYDVDNASFSTGLGTIYDQANRIDGTNYASFYVASWSKSIGDADGPTGTFSASGFAMGFVGSPLPLPG